MFLLMSVILYTGGVLSQHALQVVSQHALQQVSRGGVWWGCLVQGGCSGGVPGLGGACFGGVPAPRGCLLPGGVWPSVMVFWFGAFWFGVLLVWWPSDWRWPSGLVVFCYGLLVWSSVMAFWYALLVRPSGTGVSPNRDPFQPEGHNRRPYQNGRLGMAFWCDLLLWPSGLVPPPRRRLLLQTVHILLECILVVTVVSLLTWYGHLTYE